MTADEARQTVQAHLPPSWRTRDVYEGSSLFAVNYGSADGRPLINVPIALVDKESGEVSYAPYLGNEDFFDSLPEVA